MLPVQFDYAAPENLDTAVKLLKEKSDAVVLAGSHSLIAEMKQGHIAPSFLVDLSKISELQGINTVEKSLEINAMTTYAQILAFPEIQTNYPALAEVTKSIGDPQIRNQQAIGDVFAYRDLACDLPAASLVLEGSFSTLDTDGSQTHTAAEFIKFCFQENWQPAKIVTSVNFPAPVSGTGSAYQAFKHPATGYTLCGIAALVVFTNGTVSKCRVAVTGATPYPVRLIQVEAALEGKVPTAENITAATKLAGNDVGEILGDRYASAEYRRHLMEVISKRTLIQAVSSEQ
ncbi:MAG: xanthine dehydrogenase family protein subunit M [Sphaerospermopsis sp. SIO1G2]|nr:xanthine dehydrogenase family protein subunit M [Sphaerospermopsis sp. SIO1G1]NET72476.1 xanthine dehydrogenase family protein subunit M [Sphaerospermopsis sp. SIO1G2]